MIHGATFSGNLFFDPLATNLGNGLAAGLSAGSAGLGGAGSQDAGSALPSGPRKRGAQTAAEHRALRAASLSKVSRDLERMLRERKR
jgi:hypothetical protein